MKTGQSGFESQAQRLGDHVMRARRVRRVGPGERASVPLADKLTLSLAEASALSGLSRGYLLGAIHAGKLKAAKRGRGWNLKRADIEAWVRRL